MAGLLIVLFPAGVFNVTYFSAPLRRVSAGRTQCQLTSEELSKLKRATFVPPPPPPPPSSREFFKLLEFVVGQ